MIHRGLARPILGETREVPGRLERLSESAGRTPTTTAVALLEWASDAAMSVYTAAPTTTRTRPQAVGHVRARKLPFGGLLISVAEPEAGNLTQTLPDSDSTSSRTRSSLPTLSELRGRGA